MEHREIFLTSYLNIGSFLTHWNLDKMGDILYAELSVAFSWPKICIFGLQFYKSVSLKLQLTTRQYGFWK